MVRHLDEAKGQPFAWDLSADLPDNLRSQLEHGRSFSEIMHGAQLLYNLILAQQRMWHDQIDAYQTKLDHWWQKITDQMETLRAWDRRVFWKIVYQGNPRVSPRARRFINAWTDLVVSAFDRASIVESHVARQLVEHREVQLKGGLARVRNERARELWNGAAGAAQLDLRWSSARRIVSDILAGLEVVTHA